VFIKDNYDKYLSANIFSVFYFEILRRCPAFGEWLARDLMNFSSKNSGQARLLNKFTVSVINFFQAFASQPQMHRRPSTRNQAKS
jgi:hypothetical protein